jgi:3-deoxy-manno-octulosonate cytidylyltransferase (CMP-KDO synthetase)
MKIIGIIPARYASTRFPGKPLVEINGKSMISRVYEQAMLGNLDKVVVATDDERIYTHINDIGGEAIITSSTHTNGTERCCEVLGKIKEEFDVAINIQGDEPYIHPEQISQLAGLFENKEVQIGTLIKKIDDPADLLNPDSIKKVVVNKNSEAIYFSRSVIPFLQGVDHGKWLDSHVYYKHIGIYGYRSDVLRDIVKLPPSPLEKAESLEQLRWIENGYKIKVAITEHESPSIDVPADLELLKGLG